MKNKIKYVIIPIVAGKISIVVHRDDYETALALAVETARDQSEMNRSQIQALMRNEGQYGEDDWIVYLAEVSDD